MSAADFTLIRPVTVVDATLTSTNVNEATVAAYNGATTYAAGAIIGVTTGHTQAIYESRLSSNTGNAPASSPSWWKFLSYAYDAYNVGTTYAANDIVTVVAADSHLLYKSVQAANVGNAVTNTTWWLPWGTTNAWACLDTTYGSQTQRTDSFVMVFNLGALVNSLYLGNMDAASVRVQQSVSGFDLTILLNEHNVLDWYSWYYEPLVRKKDTVIVGGIPPYPSSSLTVTVSNVGGTAKCGLMVFGQSVVLGLTQWGLTGGILSYSGTSTDSFGNTTFAARAKAKKLNFDVRITPGFESEAYRILTEYTDMPVVFIASTDYAMASVYGYLSSWSVPLSNNGKNAPIEIKGLT